MKSFSTAQVAQNGIFAVYFFKKTSCKKTPAYTARAIKKYQQKITNRSVAFNKESEANLIKVIDDDPMPFSTLVKELLRKHYNLRLF